MIMKKIFLITTIASTIFAVGCSNNNEVGQEDFHIQENKNTISFVGGIDNNQTATRTSITHTIGNGAIAYWSSGDKIWVKDNSGVFHQSSAGVLNTTKAKGLFNMPNGMYSNGCQVNYVGGSSDGTKVTIAANQSQTVANDFSHAGVSGDCGTAIATGSSSSFVFTLQHKAAYLCLMPRSTNAAFMACKLTGIKIISNNAIAGVYDFSSGNLSTAPISSTSNTISLTTNNFSIPNIDTQSFASYVVIAPGVHTLTIQYQLLDPNTGQTGTVTKYVSSTFVAGNIYDVKSNFDTNTIGREYYLWDAKYDAWFGHTADQPYKNDTYDTNGTNNYPVSSSDIRWYNPTNSMSARAQNSSKDCPTTNEITWYAKFGDPHWDANELWAWNGMGTVQKGGMWIKKKAYISGFTASIGATGVDYNSNPVLQAPFSTPAIQGRPSSSDINKYFFLPAEGRYRFFRDGKTGIMKDVGVTGTYFPSTNTPIVPSAPDGTYSLHFTKDFLALFNGGTKKDAIMNWKAQ